MTMAVDMALVEPVAVDAAWAVSLDVSLAVALDLAVPVPVDAAVDVAWALSALALIVALIVAFMATS